MSALDLQTPESWTWGSVADASARILVIILIAVVLRWIFGRVLRRVVIRAAKGPSVDGFAGRTAGLLQDLRPGASERREQRANAMGDLLASIATLVVIAIATIMMLDVVGVPVAPILTSAGILGVALGFGAQTLVKDFLAGLFMILEDQYGVGDTVDLGEAVGTVEATGLRVTRLRSVDGTVWYVRNGEILRVGNQSQNWARSVLDLTVSYESDLDAVQAMISEEAHAMFESEDYRGVILEDPEVWGVERFDKDGVVIRLVVKTAPQQQWAVSRALRSRIKARFDAEGVTIPVSMFSPAAS